MATLNLSGLSFFMPLFSFLFVFLIVYSVMAKTKLLGEEKFTNIFVSFIVSIIFAIMVPSADYVAKVTPWFVILLVSLFLIMMLVSFTPVKLDSFMKPWFVWVFVVTLLIIFVVSAARVFPVTFDESWGTITKFVTTQSKFAGALILLAVAALVSYLITSAPVKGKS